MIDYAAFWNILFWPARTAEQATSSITMIEAAILLGIVSLLGGIILHKIHRSRERPTGFGHLVGSIVVFLIATLILSLYGQYAALLFGGTGSYLANLTGLLYTLVGSIIIGAIGVVALLALLIVFVLLLLPLLFIVRKAMFSDPIVMILGSVLGLAYAIGLVGWYVYLLAGALQGVNQIALWAAVIIVLVPLVLFIIVKLARKRRAPLPKPTPPKATPRTVTKKTAKKKSTKKSPRKKTAKKRKKASPRKQVKKRKKRL